MKHISVMLEYFYPWPNSAGIFVAREKGWYKDAGLDVECRTYDPLRGDSLSYLAVHEVDFALFPTNRYFVRREQGAPVRALAAINHQGLESIQTLTTKGINRPRDLSGKRIALNPTPRGLAMVRHVISQDGGNPDFTIIDSCTRELTPEDLASGIADATFGSYWAWEIIMYTSIPHDQRIIWPIDTLNVPPYHSYLLGTHDHPVEQSPDTVEAFVKTTERGYLYAIQHLDEAADIYEKVIPYFPQSLIRRSLDLIAPTWTHHGQWGQLRTELLLPYADWLKKQGILTKGPTEKDILRG